MRKLMKKKVSLLGKEVSVFVIVMVAMIGLATAALVPYLSGLVGGNSTIDSPFLVELSNDGGSNFVIGTGIDLGDVYGGDTIEARGKITALGQN